MKRVSTKSRLTTGRCLSKATVFFLLALLIAETSAFTRSHLSVGPESFAELAKAVNLSVVNISAVKVP